MGSAAHRRDIDMLVVSNGVTGMTMALALATYGMRVHVVSRSGWLDACPDPQLIDGVRWRSSARSTSRTT